MVYEDTAERTALIPSAKLILRHAMHGLFFGKFFMSKSKMAGISKFICRSRLWTESVRQISTPAIT